MQRLAMVLALLSLSGCYSIARGLSQEVKFYGNASVVSVARGPNGSVPCTLEVERSSVPVFVTFSRPGYQSFSVELIPVKDRVSFGRLLLLVGDTLLIVPAIVDLILYDPMFDWPRQVDVHLAKEGEGASRLVDLRR